MDPERAAEARRRDAIQKQLDELTQTYQERQNATRMAVQELRCSPTAYPQPAIVSGFGLRPVWDTLEHHQ